MFLEDKTLVKQCLGGDNNAFGKLVEKYQNMVHCLAFSYLKNFHDAEDVVQEAFLQAYLSLHQLANADKFCGWLYKIAKNISYKWQNSRSKQTIPLSDVSLEDVNEMSQQRHRDDELSVELKDALESLSDKQRAPLLLSLAGYSYEEISGFLGSSQAAIRGRIARAKQSLRRELLSDLHREVNAHKLDRQFAQGIIATISQLPTRPAPPQSNPILRRIIPASVIGLVAVIAIGLSIFYLRRGREEPQMVQSPQPLPTFTDVTAQVGLVEVGYGLGVSCVDFNNDGDIDIFLGDSGELPNLLYRNNGDFTFTDMAFQMGVDYLGNTFSGVFGDYDNDGDLDLYLANPSFRPNFLYRNAGVNGFVDVTQQAGASNTDESTGAIWGDYDGDGNLDLYVLNNTQANVLFHSNGDGTFTDVTQIAGVANFTLARDADGNTSTGIAIGDYDNDMDEDIYVANHGINALFRNNGDGTFADVAADAGVNYPLKSKGTIFFDYDKDGYLDIYVTNHEMANRLYHNNGDGTFGDVTEYSQVGDRGYGYGIGTEDFDNDGDLDIFLANQAPEKPNVMYRNNGNGNNWLRIKLVGTQNNRFGIGAKVIVFTKTHQMLRTVNSGTGFCQPSAQVDFGLVANTKAEKVEVYWPSGRLQTIPNVIANQLVEVVER